MSLQQVHTMYMLEVVHLLQKILLEMLSLASVASQVSSCRGLAKDKYLDQFNPR